MQDLYNGKRPTVWECQSSFVTPRWISAHSKRRVLNVPVYLLERVVCWGVAIWRLVVFLKKSYGFFTSLAFLFFEV